MTALAANSSRIHKNRETTSIPVAASTQIFKGALVCVLNTAGYALPAADTANYLFMGVAMEEADNSAGSDADINVKVTRGEVWPMVGVSVTQAWVGQTMYTVDDQTVGIVGQTSQDIPVGQCVEYVSTTEVNVAVTV